MIVTRALTRSNLFRFKSSVAQQRLNLKRSLVLSHQFRGPGADDKYKSEEDRNKEKDEARQRKNKLLGAAVAGGTIAGCLWGYLTYTSDKKDEVIGNDNTVKEYLLEKAPPYFKPARVIPSASDKPQNFKITLFQYQTCPFCCKARVFLDYFGLSYDVVEVNSVLRTQVKWSKYKKVPIVVVEVGDKVNINILSILSVYYQFLLYDIYETC